MTFSEKTNTKVIGVTQHKLNDTLICRCNGVTKTMILEAMQRGARNLDDIKRETKASTNCGGCQSIITRLIILGDI